MAAVTLCSASSARSCVAGSDGAVKNAEDYLRIKTAPSNGRTQLSPHAPAPTCAQRFGSTDAADSARSGAGAPTGVTVQSGCPGIGGVLVEYSQSLRKPRRSRWPMIDASAMKSCTLPDHLPQRVQRHGAAVVDVRAEQLRDALGP